MTWQPAVHQPADCGHHACHGEPKCVYPEGLLTTIGEDA